MKTRLWILFSVIVLLITFSIFIDIPKSPMWGEKIKASLGLDLVGGTELTYEADLSQSKDKIKDLDNLKNVFEKRINELGVSEPTIQTSGGNKVIIELPGVKDIDSAIQRIGQTYELNFMTEGTAEDGVQLNDYYESSYVYPGYWKKSDLTGKNLVKADGTFQGGTQSNINSEPVVAIQFDNIGKKNFASLQKTTLIKELQ
jgi:preprotein translocase subunit SecD